jgi:hypothetical protein
MLKEIDAWDEFGKRQRDHLLMREAWQHRRLVHPKRAKRRCPRGETQEGRAEGRRKVIGKLIGHVLVRQMKRVLNENYKYFSFPE